MTDRVVTVTEIQDAVIARCGVTRLDLRSRRRARTVCRPRQLAIWLACELTSRSLPEIGRMFDKDHTTVLHARRLIPALMETDPALRADAAAVLDQLRVARP